MEGGRSDRRERWRRAFVALCGSSDGEIKTDEVGQVSGFQANLALLAGRRGKKRWARGERESCPNSKQAIDVSDPPQLPPPSLIPSSNRPVISRPTISNSFDFTRSTRRENKLEGLQSRRGRRVLCSRNRRPEGSQLARDETEGRDMKLR